MNTLLKYIACFVVLLCLILKTEAQQITSIEYFFDTDPGFGNGFQVMVSPDTILQNQQITINYSSVSSGLHTFYIRSKDAIGNWSLTNRSTFYKSAFLLNTTQPVLTAIEYFFDTDPGFGNGYQLSLTADTSFNSLLSTINLLGLSSGNHTLFIRTKDANGSWSLTNRKSFTYCTSGTTTYYLDTDNDGYGNPSQTIIACTVPTGYSTDNTDCDDNDSMVHQTYPFYVDADSDGYGDINQLQMVCASNANDAPIGYATNSSDCNDSNPNIVPGTTDQFEYFIDADPSTGQGIQLNVSSSSLDSISMISAINIPSTLNEGIHTIAIRAHACNFGWGLFENRLFDVTRNDIATGPITNAEFFIDTDPGLGNAIPFSISSMDTINQFASFNIPSNTDPGNHNIGIRVKDSLGNWGHFTTIFVDVLAPPIPTYPIVAAEYFIDSDPGIGNANPLNIVSADTLIHTIAIPTPSNLSEGHHLIGIRVKNSQGDWGLFENRTFIVDDTNPAYNPIVAAEYIIDNDLGVGNGTPISISIADTVDETISLSIPSSYLTNAHKIAFRVKNFNGQWSHFELPPIPIHIKAFIQGYYNTSGMMQPVLSNQGQNNSISDVDTMFVDIHTTTWPYQTIHTTKGVLQVDGKLNVQIPYTFQGQSNYIALRHRNAIETWSSNPMTMNLYENAYDFTTAVNKAFGNNLKEIDNGIWALYSGDINQDENIDLLDFSLLENDINSFQFGYFATDINGDGNVDLLDGPIVENNINGFIFSNHP
ncbi:MAG TPA: dockerin type I domain-containing protein [Chitinophagaceae bacterium]|nr:dockerin type I domain-containing protein [Chitinophagaceae bacterium]